MAVDIIRVTLLCPTRCYKNDSFFYIYAYVTLGYIQTHVTQST